MTRLTLANGQTIDVKDKVKVKDKRDIHSYSVDGVSSDGKTYRFNVVKHNIATAAARIVNWTVMDDGSTHKDGQPKPILWPGGKSFQDRVDVIEGLDEDLFDDLSYVLNVHLRSLDEAASEEKKETQDGKDDSTQNSSSVN